MLERFRGIADEVSEIEMEWWTGLSVESTPERGPVGVYPVTKGKPRLFFFQPPEDARFYGGPCTPWVHLRPGDGTLEFVRRYFSGTTTTKIHGTVWVNAKERSVFRYVAPAPNLAVKASGTAGVFPTRTDANGNFAIEGFPPGEYRLQAEAENWEALQEAPAVRVRPRGCVQQDLGVRPLNSLSGSVYSRM